MALFFSWIIAHPARYLIVVRKREVVGRFMEQTVYRATKMEAISVLAPTLTVPPNKTLYTKADKKAEAAAKKALDTVLGLGNCYFSFDFDMTRHLQARSTTSGGTVSPALPSLTRADNRFVWNRHVATDVVRMGLVDWVLPLVLGYVGVGSAIVAGKSVRLALISRRSADRPGRRLTVRGADMQGEVANFVETEMLLSHSESVASFVQVRGSMPLLWAQPAALTLKPRPTLKHPPVGGAADAGMGGAPLATAVAAANGDAQLAPPLAGGPSLSTTPAARHFKKLTDTYGSVTAVSLIDSTGPEAVLGRELASILSVGVTSGVPPSVRYLAWDFHTECAGMKYDKVGALLASIRRDVEAYGVCRLRAGRLVKSQSGVVRTNCVDSLDRTNVVQCALAATVADDVLRAFGVLLVGGTATDRAAVGPRGAPSFATVFQHLWADNADEMSRVYAGSPALKTDYTRTGKRSKVGAARDGVSSARRYVANNFSDGGLQDALDVWAGVASARKADARPPGADETPEEVALKQTGKDKALLPAVAVCLALAVVGAMYGRRWYVRVGLAVAFSGAAAGAGYMVVKNGRKYVSRPKLQGTA